MRRQSNAMTWIVTTALLVVLAQGKPFQHSTQTILMDLRGGKTGPPKKAAQAVISHKEDHLHHENELMSPTIAVANVLADLCPHGMLPIAYGVAAAGGTGPALATICLAVFGCLSWYSLVSFARAAEAVLVTNTTTETPGESLSAVWSKIVPNVSKYIPDLGCFLLTVGCLLFYSAFIGDLFGALVSGWTGLPQFFRKRWSILLALHAIPILPLCLKKDLSALKYSSMTGLLGIVYTIFFVAKRLTDHSYAPGGKFFSHMPFKYQPAAQVAFPSLQQSNLLGYIADIPPWHAGKGLLILMNMCCVAFACHYNAVKYYMELKTRTVPALKQVMTIGIGGTGLVFLTMMILGYGTFGAHSQALLLNNYHPTLDRMATVARGFTGLAIISGYPLMFAGLKAALFSLLSLDGPHVVHKEQKQTVLSAVVVTCIAVAACFVTEHELSTVIGIVGSIFGSVVIYIFPGIVNNSLLKMKDKEGNPLSSPFFKGEVIFNNFLVVFGIVFAILGTFISIQQG